MEVEMNEEEKINMMRKIFRRSSIDTNKFEGVINSNMMGVILNSMGQSYDTAELNRWIAKFDNTGKIDYDAYTRICGHFIKNPAALVKSANDKYSFKNLINLADFENP